MRPPSARGPGALPALFLAALLAAGLPAPARGAAGKDGFAFLSMTDGARESAMGGVGGALADGVDASLDNPAALGVMRSREASVSYASLPASLSYGALSYAHPLQNGALAFHGRLLRYGDISGFDASGQKTASFTAQDSLLALGYGRAAGARWSLGAAVRQVGESIAGRSVSVYAADAGFLWRAPAAGLTFSGGARNVGGEARLVREGALLPRTAYGGAATRLFSDAWVAALQAERGADGETVFHVGQELWLYNALGLRAGWRSDRDLGNGLSLGFGVKLREMRVDYSFSAQADDFGASHRVGLTFRFGGAAEDAYQRGLKLSQQGHYAEAILAFKDALDADPGRKDAVRGLREAVAALERERGRP